MKTLKYIIFFFLILLNISCEQNVELYDFEKYKFVSFIDKEISVSENYSEAAIGEEKGFPIYLQYEGSILDEDFTADLNIEENLAQEGIDYSVVSKTVLFKAGSIRSEPFYITLLDNLVNTDDDKFLNISIVSVSNPKIDIGVGIVNQSNKNIIVNILDNECSEGLEVFDSEALGYISNYSNTTIKGTLDEASSELKLEGDLVAYVPLANTSLVIKLNPVEEGAKIGSVTFDDYYAGTDTDGWEYTYIQEGEATFDICEGAIKNLAFGVYYLSGGSWVYWYSVSGGTIIIP